MVACKQCGKEFKQRKGPGRKRLFCCESCQRIWWKNNREAHGKVYRFTCQNCGKEYETLYSNRDTCCSRECGWEWISKQAWVEKECLSCGEAFTEKGSGPGYCCQACQERGRRKSCAECGAVFYGPDNALYCSRDECRKARNRRRHSEYKLKIGKNSGREESITCGHCGKTFTQVVHNQLKQYCSKRCSRAAWKEAHPRKWRRMRKKAAQMRRARKYDNGPVEPIDPIAVFERDGWICGICGRPVNKELGFPHPLSASLDHIIALAEGGTHTWSNVQCSHFMCNSRKRETGGGQLRIGLRCA